MKKRWLRTNLSIKFDPCLGLRAWIKGLTCLKKYIGISSGGLALSCWNMSQGPTSVWWGTNKYVLWKCSALDERGFKAFQDTRNVWQGCAHWATVFFIYTKPFKLDGLCIKAARKNAYALDCMSDNLKMQKICNETIRENPATFFLVLDRFKTHEMCNDAADVEPWQLKDFPNHFKTQKTSDNVVLKYSYSLQLVPDWFVTWQ